MIVLGLIHTRMSWKLDDDDAVSLVTTLTRTLEHQTESSLRSVDTLLQEAAQRIDPDHWPDPVLVSWFQSRLVGFPELRNMIVAREDGRTAGSGLSAAGPIGIPIDVSDRQHFRAHRAGQNPGEMIIGDPITDRLDGRQIIPLSRAIHDSEGRFRGMVAIGLDPSFLVKALETLLIEPAGGISVIRRDGIMLARLPDQYGSFGRSVAKSQLFTKFVAEAPAGIARFVSVSDGNSKIVGYSTLERYPVLATVGITEETAYSQSRLEAMAAFAAIFLVSVAVYWLAYLTDQREGARNQLAERLEAQSKDLERQVRDRTSHLARLQAETDRKARLLASSNADLEQFAYVASHDLQEPLRAVANHLQLLQSRHGANLDAEAREHIDFAVTGAKRLHERILDLLAFSRVTTSGGDFAQCDLQVVVNDALDSLRLAISDSKAVIEVGPMPKLPGDFAQLSSLFQNLIDNAIKYRRPDLAPQIRIEALRNLGEWVVAVRDNGIGIDPEYKDRVFVIFQRLHGVGQYEGTGIGLAICKRIVERHGGSIWLDSQPGLGTTFHFTLPVEAQA